MNDHQFKLVKSRATSWHKHSDTDEVFIVLDGSMTVHLRDSETRVQAGELVLSRA